MPCYVASVEINSHKKCYIVRKRRQILVSILKFPGDLNPKPPIKEFLPRQNPN